MRSNSIWRWSIGAVLGSIALVLGVGLMPAEVAYEQLMLHSATGLLYDGNVPFTGVTVRKTDQGHERARYRDGRRHGTVKTWWADGTLSYHARYADGRRHGTVKTWWADGTLRSEARYVKGVPHGIQRQWYRSGARFKELRLDMGRESGMQRAWRENGTLYANYEARSGRVFGLKRADLCFNLDDEVIQLSDLN
ncbi:MAG: toxin-antitoxin system YwqK family antitoxin [Bacteroidota bacterium]